MHCNIAHSRGNWVNQHVVIFESCCKIWTKICDVMIVTLKQVGHYVWFWFGGQNISRLSWTVAKSDTSLVVLPLFLEAGHLFYLFVCLVCFVCLLCFVLFCLSVSPFSWSWPAKLQSCRLDLMTHRPLPHPSSPPSSLSSSSPPSRYYLPVSHSPLLLVLGLEITTSLAITLSLSLVEVWMDPAPRQRWRPGCNSGDALEVARAGGGVGAPHSGSHHMEGTRRQLPPGHSSATPLPHTLSAMKRAVWKGGQSSWFWWATDRRRMPLTVTAGGGSSYLPPSSSAMSPQTIDHVKGDQLEPDSCKVTLLQIKRGS